MANFFIYYQLYWKDENREKEADEGQIKKILEKRTKHITIFYLAIFSIVLLIIFSRYNIISETDNT